MDLPAGSRIGPRIRRAGPSPAGALAKPSSPTPDGPPLRRRPRRPDDPLTCQDLPKAVMATAGAAAEENRPTMRTTVILAIAGGLALGAIGFRTAADDRPEPAPDPVAARFRAEVRPFLETYCLGCHGKDKPKGDMDLGAFTTVESVAKDLPRWDLVLEQLEAGSMPPAKAKTHPTPAARDGVIAWIGAVRKLEATRHAGDPGPVPARRLSNAEYDNTIRDLTGVDLRPTREFPVDPANEAGFDNSAESLAMSPAAGQEVPGGRPERRRAPRPEAGRTRLRAAPDARRHRPRQVLRQGDHRLLQEAEDRLRRLLPRRLAVPAPRRPRPPRRCPRRLRRRAGAQPQVPGDGLVHARRQSRRGRADRRAPDSLEAASRAEGRSAGRRAGRLRADAGLRRRAAAPARAPRSRT